MMEGNNAYMKYMQTHKHTKVSDGTVSIDQLPLIKVEPKSKKSFKEFFQVIRNVSDVDVAAIRSVMSEASPKYAHLPASVRPRDALGDSCVLQLVLENLLMLPGQSSSSTTLRCQFQWAWPKLFATITSSPSTTRFALILMSSRRAS